MTEEETDVAKAKEKLEFEKLRLEIAELKKAWWRKSSSAAAVFPAILVLVILIYGFANGYFQSSSAKLENQTYNLRKQIEQLQVETAELSKQKEMLERKRSRISEQLEKTKILLEKSKDAPAEVNAHIEVIKNTCLSCPTPAWVESHKMMSSTFNEIAKIIDENNLNASAK